MPSDSFYSYSTARELSRGADLMERTEVHVPCKDELQHVLLDFRLAQVSMEPSPLPTSRSTSSLQTVESAASQPKWNFQDSDGTPPLQMHGMSTNSEPRSSLLDRSPQRLDLDRGSFDEGTREASVPSPVTPDAAVGSAMLRCFALPG